MQRMKSGPAVASTTTSPVEQPDTTSQKHQTSAYYTRTDKPCHPRTYEAPLHTWTDALAFFIFAALIVASAFITLYMLIAVLFVLAGPATP